MRTTPFDLNYKAIEEFLAKGRNSKRGRAVSRNTVVEEATSGNQKVFAIYLYSTRILTYFPNGDICIGTNSWRSHTTINRVNTFIPNDLGVYSDRRGYVLRTPKGKFHFEDNCIIKPDGSTNCKPWDDHVATVKAERTKIVEQRKKWRSAKGKIDKFTEGYFKALWGRKLSLKNSNFSIVKIVEKNIYEYSVLHDMIEEGWPAISYRGEGNKTICFLSDTTKNVILALQDKAEQRWLLAVNEDPTNRELREAFRHLLFAAFKVPLDIPFLR